MSMSPHRGLPLVVGWLLLYSGCLEELPDVTAIDGIRVLAIRADPPEAQPGDEVTIQILRADATQRPATYEWYLCKRPERGRGFLSGQTSTAGASGGGGYGLDDTGDCISAGRAGSDQVDYLGDSSIVRATIPDDLFEDNETLAALYGLPATIDPSVYGFLNSIAGVNLTVAVRVTVAGDSRDAFKRINISSAPDRNFNPEDTKFHITPDGSGETPPAGLQVTDASENCFLREEGAAITATPGDYVLTPVGVPDPQALYSVLFITPDVTNPIQIEERSEEYFYSFFATAGSFTNAITKATGGGSTTWSIPPETSGPVDIWIVSRDGRGGTDWCHSRLTIVRN